MRRGPAMNLVEQVEAITFHGGAQGEVGLFSFELTASFVPDEPKIRDYTLYVWPRTPNLFSRDVLRLLEEGTALEFTMLTEYRDAGPGVGRFPYTAAVFK